MAIFRPKTGQNWPGRYICVSRPWISDSARQSTPLKLKTGRISSVTASKLPKWPFLGQKLGKTGQVDTFAFRDHESRIQRAEIPYKNLKLVSFTLLSRQNGQNGHFLVKNWAKLARLIHLRFATMKFGFSAPKHPIKTWNWSDLLCDCVKTAKL